MSNGIKVSFDIKKGQQTLMITGQGFVCKQKQKRRKRKNNTDASEAGTSTDPLTQDNDNVHAQTNKGKQSSSSQFRGVTLDRRRTGRWMARMKDNGRDVYLGSFDTEEKAARAFDLFALKCRGSKAEINFLLEDYTEELAQVTH